MTLKIDGTAGLDFGTGQITQPVGTVSQASGVPTGAIVESSNVGGTDFYIRYADGTQICWGSLSSVTMSANNQVVQRGINFAKAFSATYPVTLTGTGQTDTSYDWYGLTSVSVSTTTGSLTFRNGATLQNLINVRYFAIGRWF